MLTADNLPLVTIVTPSYNQAEFIQETIESVLSQDYPKVEYVVMDGGSTDGTQEVLARFEGRLRWVSQRDDGQSDAIARGFETARGEVIAWLNADDVYMPGAISRAVDALVMDDSVGLVYGHAEFVDRGGVFVAQHDQSAWSLDDLIARTNYIPQPATFFRKRAYESVGGIDRALHYCMDYDLWIRLGRQFRVRQVPETLARIRLYRETKTASGGLERVAEIRQMIRRHGRAHLPESVQWDFVRESWRAGTEAARGGRRLAAIRLWAASLPAFAHPFVFRTALQVIGRRVPRWNAERPAP